MTVKELIEQLKTMDQDSKVVILLGDDGDLYSPDISEVREGRAAFAGENVQRGERIVGIFFPTGYYEP